MRFGNTDVFGVAVYNPHAEVIVAYLCRITVTLTRAKFRAVA